MLCSPNFCSFSSVVVGGLNKKAFWTFSFMLQCHRFSRRNLCLKCSRGRDVDYTETDTPQWWVAAQVSHHAVLFLVLPRKGSRTKDYKVFAICGVKEGMLDLAWCFGGCVGRTSCLVAGLWLPPCLCVVEKPATSFQWLLVDNLQSLDWVQKST